MKAEFEILLMKHYLGSQHENKVVAEFYGE